MNKLLLILLSTTCILWSATDTQIEEYLSVSTADEQLLQIESQFSAMQNSFSQNEESSTPYDMELLSIRFKDYLQRNLSENEMDEVLKNYRSVVYLQFAAASMETPPDTNETQAYIKALESDEEASSRLDLLENIDKALNKKESMIIMFDALMKPMIQSSMGAEKIDKKTIELQREAYMKAMVKEAREETLYLLREFSIEDLEALLIVVKTPAVGHETKAVYGAIAYALKEFFLSMASRYDVSKHQPKQPTDTNDTK
jgi:hypothetical protein